MSARSLALVDAARGPEAIRCAKPECGQLLAHRYGVVIVPIGATVKRERDGRIRLQCPSCGARITVVDERKDDAA